MGHFSWNHLRDKLPREAFHCEMSPFTFLALVVVAGATIPDLPSVHGAKAFSEECVRWESQCDNGPTSCNENGCIGRRKRSAAKVDSELPVVQVEALVQGKRVKRACQSFCAQWVTTETSTGPKCVEWDSNGRCVAMTGK